MSVITDISHTNLSSKTTERLIHNIPKLINPTKSVSQWMIYIIENLNYYSDKRRPSNESIISIEVSNRDTTV